ncbi:MAG: hypothetical protein QNL43_09120 [Crocinitomicaceae bacterium]|jgi:hypothetical protein|tara:strand:+ start:41661 stop:42467 length:807 start_codon:yes stop_codon:yes gene_type:complete
MKLSLLLFLILPLFVFGQYKLLSTEGQYQGDKLFIKNPKQMDGFGYCIIKVTVNGEVLPASIQSPNFEVDFSLFNLEIGDDVFVVIEHFDGCTPRFLNPKILLPESTFKLKDIRMKNKQLLQWETENEKGILDYDIEQFKWNNWESVGQVRGKGLEKSNIYSFKVSPHSGENKFRVTQTDNSGEKRISQEIIQESDIEKYTMSPSRVRDYIFFYSAGELKKTRFEVFDAFGNLLKVGLSNNVDCRNIVNGIYYMNYDNKTEKFLKVSE